MKLKHNRMFDLFVVDPLPPNFPAIYECDPDAPRVIVDAKPSDRLDVENKRIRMERGPQNTLLTPFEVESEEQFEKLGIEAILVAHRIFKHEVRELRDAKKMFESEKELDVGKIAAVLMSDREKPHKIYEVSKFCVDNGCKLQMYSQIQPNYVYILPEPEFLGVIPIETLADNSERYALGIINTRPIVKVFIG